MTEDPDKSTFIDIDEYFAQTQYDGAQQVKKEKNLKSFFLQKCQRVNNYLEKPASEDGEND